MAAYDTANTKQHYVPQMLLRGFATPSNPDQVWVFDKQTERSFPCAIENIGAERGYYDIEGSAALDSVMNRSDDLTAPIIARIRERRSVAGIGFDDRVTLAAFVVLQMLRTRGFQEESRVMGESLIETLTQRNQGIRPEWLEEQSKDEVREDYLRSISRFTRDFVPYLLEKDLLLYRADPAMPFQISDNPVVMDNTMNRGDGIRGTLGFGVIGVEIYMPISSELTLAYMCPSIGIQFQELADDLWRSGGFINEAANGYLTARNTGRWWKITADNVRHQNSLQAWNAERFVISSVDAFDDVGAMVRDYPNARFGRRVKVG